MGIWFDVAAGGAAGMNIDNAANLFRHVTADKTTLYRAIMDVFAAAKRQYRRRRRPDEVLGGAAWNGVAPISSASSPSDSTLPRVRIRSIRDVRLGGKFVSVLFWQHE